MNNLGTARFVKEILASSPEFQNDLLRLASATKAGKISLSYASSAIEAIYKLASVRRAGIQIETGPYGKSGI